MIEAFVPCFAETVRATPNSDVTALFAAAVILGMAGTLSGVAFAIICMAFGIEHYRICAWIGGNLIIGGFLFSLLSGIACLFYLIIGSGWACTVG